MRQRLEQLANNISRIDSDNLYEAVAEIKGHMIEIVKLVDQALPMEVEND